MNIPKTLDEARSMVAELAASNESLTVAMSTLTEAGANQEALETQVSQLTIELVEVKAALESRNAEFNASMQISVDEKTALTARVSELEDNQKTVSAQARELLAAQGGKPLAIAGDDLATANRAELTSAFEAETDAVKRMAIYKQLKAAK